MPTILNKAVPDFCSVYVIAKGKIESIRYAARSASSSATPQRQKSPRSRSPLKSDHHGPHDVSRYIIRFKYFCCEEFQFDDKGS